jgi:murein DD-endopeptidase MepM/ murein hydrolase activator NlpD
MKFTHNPLKTCKLRTAGLYSVKGAMFGLTRKNKDGSIRAHQGIDLATDEGYRLYAVENSEVVAISKGSNGYGFTVTLKLNCVEKPELHNKFAFYAHCDRIDVQVGDHVKAGDQIALSGDTGNAKGMATVSKGGHLHFELRTKQVCGLGLKNRLDPLPFIELI